MKWEFNYPEHKTVIIEVGVDKLKAVCITHDVELGMFTQNDYPKYRLAYRAAAIAIQDHVSPVDTPAPVE